MEGVQTYGGVQMYWSIRTPPKYVGHPSIWGASKHMRGIQTYEGVQTYVVSKHTGDIQIYAGGV